MEPPRSNLRFLLHELQLRAGSKGLSIRRVARLGPLGRRSGLPRGHAHHAEADHRGPHAGVDPDGRCCCGPMVVVDEGAHQSEMATIRGVERQSANRSARSACKGIKRSGKTECSCVLLDGRFGRRSGCGNCPRVDRIGIAVSGHMRASLAPFLGSKPRFRGLGLTLPPTGLPWRSWRMVSGRDAEEISV